MPQLPISCSGVFPFYIYHCNGHPAQEKKNTDVRFMDSLRVTAVRDAASAFHAEKTESAPSAPRPPRRDNEPPSGIPQTQHAQCISSGHVPYRPPPGAGLSSPSPPRRRCGRNVLPIEPPPGEYPVSSQARRIFMRGRGSERTRIDDAMNGSVAIPIHVQLHTNPAACRMGAVGHVFAEHRFRATLDSRDRSGCGVAGSDPSSAVYVDGVYLARPAMVSPTSWTSIGSKCLRPCRAHVDGHARRGWRTELVTKPPAGSRWRLPPDWDVGTPT